jgi:alpha,alpha-trehalase
MRPKIKSLSKKLKLQKSRSFSLTKEDVQIARDYIKAHWTSLERFNPKTGDSSLVSLPKPYLVPAYEQSHSFDFNELYYWDSYFMLQGLLDKDHKELVMGILEDLISLFKRYHVIPNASRTYLTGHSQPPLLTSFIFDIYDAYKLDDDWLKNKIEIAKEEYHTVWMGTKKPNERLVYEGLSRYYDINHIDDLAEAESGWDMTPRFSRRALNYLPVDLNSLLYKYESDFARAAEILGDKKENKLWKTAMEKRAQTIHRLMWDRINNLYFDYNYTKKKRSHVASLASFYPLWCGMASEPQAKKLAKSLARFEYRGGLATTDTATMNRFMPYSIAMQWAYPNGWAPLHFITVKGLQKYGYNDQAKKIAMKWLKTNLDWFNAHGVFLEKYNVVSPKEPPANGLYPSQTGFGWTNAVFENFCQEFIDKQ